MKNSILILILFIGFIGTFQATSQTLVREYAVTDLVGRWEYQIPGTNEYVEYHFFDLLGTGVVYGEFRKYTRDQSGQIDRVIFDSSSPTESETISYAAFSGISKHPDNLGAGEFSFLLVDRGITNNDPDLHLWRLGKVKIFRDCTTCVFKIEVSFYGKGGDPEYTQLVNDIQLPDPVIMEKMN